MTRQALPLRVSAALLALLASAACELDFVPRAEAREEWKKSYTVAANGQLAIENMQQLSGKIIVRPSSGSTVDIVATRIARAGSEEAAKKLLADTRIEETASASSVRLTNRTPMNLGGDQYQVEYEVRAPVGIALILRTTNGTIDVADWEGRLEMSATNGTLEGTGLKGEVNASTTNGRIRLRLAALAEAGATLETTNGTIVVEVPKDAKGRLVARVVNGGISVDGLNAEPSPANTQRRYEAVLNGGSGPTISIETTNGGISVRGAS